MAILTAISEELPLSLLSAGTRPPQRPVYCLCLRSILSIIEEAEESTCTQRPVPGPAIAATLTLLSHTIGLGQRMPPIPRLNGQQRVRRRQMKWTQVVIQRQKVQHDGSHRLLHRISHKTQSQLSRAARLFALEPNSPDAAHRRARSSPEFWWFQVSCN